MDRIKILGGQSLRGTIAVSGAKNAALPLMVLGLMTEQPLILEGIPALTDIQTMHRILEGIGASVHHFSKRFVLQTHRAKSLMASYDDVRKMRASFLVLGAMLGRFGSGTVSLPGGCAIGLRPINYHLEGFQAMGATIDISNGYVVATAPKGRLPGGHYAFPKPTVTGTLNLLFAAVLASGETCLENVVMEPEVIDVIDCLQNMGAKIEGKGTPTLHIQGVDHLSGTQHSVLPDRIEMGTYMIAAALTQGDIILEGGELSLLPTAVDCLRSAGATIVDLGHRRIRIHAQGRPQPFHLSTEPFPGFPTDLQAQFMALATLADGESTIVENIWENRFMHVAELCRMGASIRLDKQCATIQGRPHLTAAHIMATDLRASGGLVLAGLVAKGETTIHRIYHLDRGYEELERKLHNCGAIIHRVSDHNEIPEELAYSMQQHDLMAANG
jgi:UDP-N-acetylglucosamine 1-carboxyvinyltransferase